MYSPFPGMDPWLEGHDWPDVHHHLATEFKQQLIPQVVPKYFVRIETYTFEDKDPGEEVGVMYPDVEVLKRRPLPNRERTWEDEGGMAVLTTPATLTLPLPLPLIEVNIPVVEIYDLKSQQLVTAIEILSPVNKHGEGLQQYQKKRKQLWEDGVHLLEVDLLRRHRRPGDHPALPDLAHYFVMLIRAKVHRTEVWAMTVQDKLPIVPVPLKSPDPDVRLDLDAALTAVYDSSRYDLSVDYEDKPPPPAFSQEDLTWLKGLVKEKLGN